MELVTQETGLPLPGVCSQTGQCQNGKIKDSDFRVADEAVRRGLGNTLHPISCEYTGLDLGHRTLCFPTHPLQALQPAQPAG
ncbi:hypothetical protein I79_025872 [Cricetulus griseus]|uniref:Uncharacterized protein n=1 Tax=Cricetulus griseus TaxID=10029 RepID=G3IPG3_CRIGR|nr:hypothetical protein I79_025872 [Cricetulus griseus]